MASWNKENLLTLIELYREKECLWKIKSKDYFNRSLKDAAYSNIIEYVRTFDPSADRDSIVKKINNIRSAFRKELKKVEMSKLSGADTDEIYIPKLWYFDRLLFLSDQEIPRRTVSDIGLGLQFLPEQNIDEDLEVKWSTLKSEPLSPQAESEVSASLDSSEELNLQVEHEPLSPQTESVVSMSLGGSEELDRTVKSPLVNFTESSNPTSKALSDVKRTKKRKREDDLTKTARLRLLNPGLTPAEDEFDVFGKSIAHRLRNLAKDQRIHAQKFISDILYEAELGQLCRMPGYSFMSMTRPERLPTANNDTQMNRPTIKNGECYDS